MEPETIDDTSDAAEAVLDLDEVQADLDAVEQALQQLDE